MDVTVCIPTIPPRRHLLERALLSVAAQTLQPVEVIVEVDTEHRGATATRNRALERVTTPLVAFLDDDDEFLPHHLAVLAAALITQDADLVYSWFAVVGGVDPFPQFFGVPWDDANPRQTTITTVAKTAAIRAVGGFRQDSSVDLYGNRIGEDYLLSADLARTGHRIVHVPERTWLWHHHASNTSGRSDRW